MNQKLLRKDEIILDFLKNELNSEGLSELLNLSREGLIDEDDFEELYNIWQATQTEKGISKKYDPKKGFDEFKKRIGK